MSPVPSREKVLRGLFWKLLFRGRAAHDAVGHKRRKQISLGLTLALYGVFGLFPAAAAFWLQPLAFACSLHMMTLLFASLTLAGSVGTMLFVREEAEILLHRPVAAAELLRAKCAVLVTFSLLLALALNAIGLVTSFWNAGNVWWFPAAHVLTTLLLMLFSAALIVLVYNVCLRWFGRERFENLLTLVQVLVTIMMVVGAQLVPRALDSEMLKNLDATGPLALALPPVWFGALDMLLCAALPFEKVWLPAAIGVGATALLTWLAFVKLGSSYGVGLLALSETSSPVVERVRRRRLGVLLRLPPLRWWLRDAIERQSFLLTSAYLVRDREIKLKLYPTLAPLVVMPVVMGLGVGRRGDGGPDAFLDALPLAYTVVVPVTAMMLLRRSEQWRAADVFRMAPLPHWTPLFHGARKAVLCWLAVPAVLLVAAILAAMRGSWTPFAMALPILIAVVVCSCVPGLVSPWLPLSQPNSEQHGMSIGCIALGAVIMGAMLTGMLAAGMDRLGWFWPFLAMASVLGVGLQALFVRSMRNRRWRPAEQ